MITILLGNSAGKLVWQLLKWAKVLSSNRSELTFYAQNLPTQIL